MEPPTKLRTPDPTYTETLAERIANAKRDTQPFVLVHSSGIEARVTRPSLTHLMTMGRVPTVFTDIINDQIRRFNDGKTTVGEIRASAEKNFERVAEDMLAQHGLTLLTMMESLYQETALAGFVSPALTTDPSKEDLRKNILWIGRIDARDIEAFYVWCNKEAALDVDAAKSDDGSESASEAFGIVDARQAVRLPADGDVSGVGDASRSDQI